MTQTMTLQDAKLWNMQAAINDVLIENGMRFNERHPDFDQADQTAHFCLIEYSDQWTFEDASDFDEAAREWFEDTQFNEPKFLRKFTPEELQARKVK